MRTEGRDAIRFLFWLCAGLQDADYPQSHLISASFRPADRLKSVARLMPDVQSMEHIALSMSRPLLQKLQELMLLGNQAGGTCVRGALT